MSGDNNPLDAGANLYKVERSVVLPYVPASVAGARRHLCGDLRAMEIVEERIDDAALVLSELVSNALRHAGPLPVPAHPENTLGVAWRIEVDRGAGSGGWLEVSVRDGGSGTMPRLARPSVSDLGGRGLDIVQHLSGRWGTEMDATTTTVWAVLDLSASDVGPAPRDGTDGTPQQESSPGRESSGLTARNLAKGTRFWSVLH